MRLKARSEQTNHLFYSELIQHLLIAHILDLYDIHARGRQNDFVTEHHAQLVRKFIELLYQGNFIEHRNLSYYAQKLFVSPHYLSEVCRKVSGKGASYFIDRFTMQEICRLLLQKEYSLTDIAEKLIFPLCLISAATFKKEYKCRLRRSEINLLKEKRMGKILSPPV